MPIKKIFLILIRGYLHQYLLFQGTVNINDVLVSGTTLEIL